MNLNVEKNKDVANIVIELNAEELAPYLDIALTNKIKNFETPGFRKGKMPKEMFVKKYTMATVFPDTIDNILNELYPKVAMENKLNVIAAPEFDWEKLIISEEEGFKVTGVVELMPEIEVKDYKDVHKTVTKNVVTVDEKEVDDKIASLLDNKAIIEVKEGNAELGDTVVIDFEGFKDGVAFEGGKGENHSLVLGSNTFIPGFEEQLVGVKAGDEIEVKVSFPTDYHVEDLAGAPVNFKCIVHEVKTKIIPTLTDELVKEIQGYDVKTVEEFKSVIKAEINDAKLKEAESAYSNEIIEILIKNADFTAPKAMIKEETDNTITNFKNQLKQQGMEFEMYLQMLGMTEEIIRKDIDNESKRKIEEMLVLDAIVKTEDFNITDEDVNNKLEELAVTSKMTVEEVRKLIGDMERLKRDMAFDMAYKLILGE